MHGLSKALFIAIVALQASANPVAKRQTSLGTTPTVMPDPKSMQQLEVSSSIAPTTLAPDATPRAQLLPAPYATNRGQSAHSEAYNAREVPENYPRSRIDG